MRTCSVTVRRTGPVMAGHGDEEQEERLTGVPLQSLVVQPDCHNPDRTTLAYQSADGVMPAWDVDEFQTVDDDIPLALLNHTRGPQPIVEPDRVYPQQIPVDDGETP